MTTSIYLRRRFHGLFCLVILLLLAYAVPPVSALQRMSIPGELIPSLEERVKEGDPQAAYALALGYYRGQVKPFDAQRMIQLAQDAVIAGNDNAALLLADIYGNGRVPVVEGDELKASYYMARFLYRGNPIGDNYQGTRIIFSLHDEPCLLLCYACDLIDSAASSGLPEAVCHLGLFRQPSLYQFLEETDNEIYALPYFELSAKYGDELGLTMMGLVSYNKGDKNRARDFLREATVFGYGPAAYEYATCFLDPSDQEMREQSIRILTSAAERGCAKAQRKLGEILIQYAADEKMREEGKKWIEYSALPPTSCNKEQ